MNKEISATKEHCTYCFDVLSGYLENPSKFQAPPLPETIENARVPIFVTWHATVDGERDLRGCIGTFAPDDLSKLLPSYTLTSAIKDRRFPPISKKELPTLDCGVSLLINFEEARDARDWEVGKHGIKIFFDSDGRSNEATFLPEVAKEQGWDIDTTLEHLIKKAGSVDLEGSYKIGHHGDPKKIIPNIRLVRYQSSKHELTYEEYTKLRR